MPKNGPIWASFLQAETCGQTELPDRSLLIGQNLMENAKKGPILARFWKAETCGQIVTLRSQKLLENAKIQKFKCDIFGNFRTVWGLYS